MNSFGRIFRVSIFGESHGPSVGAVVDGCPPGIPLSEDDFEADLSRRRAGGEGTTKRVEPDLPRLESGVFEGRTTGTPILVRFANTDVDSSAYDSIRFTPRPGHADFAAQHRSGRAADCRGGGHFSGRLTVALVAAGVIAKKVILPARAEAEVTEAGGAKDPGSTAREAAADGDSIGGVVECRVTGLPIGLGEPFFDSAESVIGHLAFAIPGVKAIEFGVGFVSARMRGSAYNDAIVDANGRTATNNAGGLNGGLTNGNEVVFRVAVRPTASIAKPQKTIDLRSGDSATISVAGRHDACIALRVPVILEAVAAIAFADLVLISKAMASQRGKE
ncbi:MAG: chorismate synthase [Deltaproteobacteria bacterium]|nr:chorismate synthase [Deltaproteobacteria bacterium]